MKKVSERAVSKINVCCPIRRIERRGLMCDAAGIGRTTVKGVEKEDLYLFICPLLSRIEVLCSAVRGTFAYSIARPRPSFIHLDIGWQAQSMPRLMECVMVSYSSI